ncbi:hypothetical protein SNEBB_007390 [Seison nebaliae]|nr:hypothetical protein SNEBB_007390 [Seison nebaliae]
MNEIVKKRKTITSWIPLILCIVGLFLVPTIVGTLLLTLTSKNNISINKPKNQPTDENTNSFGSATNLTASNFQENETTSFVFNYSNITTINTINSLLSIDNQESTNTNNVKIITSTTRSTLRSNNITTNISGETTTYNDDIQRYTDQVTFSQNRSRTTSIVATVDNEINATNSQLITNYSIWTISQSSKNATSTLNIGTTTVHNTTSQWNPTNLFTSDKSNFTLISSTVSTVQESSETEFNTSSSLIFTVTGFTMSFGKTISTVTSIVSTTTTTIRTTISTPIDLNTSKISNFSLLASTAIDDVTSATVTNSVSFGKSQTTGKTIFASKSTSRTSINLDSLTSTTEAVMPMYQFYSIDATSINEVLYKVDTCEEQTASSIDIQTIPNLPFFLVSGIETRYVHLTPNEYDYDDAVNGGVIIFLDWNYGQEMFYGRTITLEKIYGDSESGKIRINDTQQCLFLFDCIMNDECTGLLMSSSGKLLHYVKQVIEFTTVCDFITEHLLDGLQNTV